MFFYEKELKIIQFTGNLRVSGEEWIGEGFWPCPRDDVFDDVFVRNVTFAFSKGLMKLIGQHEKYFFKMHASKYTVRGPLAETFRRRFDDLTVQDERLILWLPLWEVHYGLT